MLTVDAHHIQSRHDRTVQPGLPSVLGSFHAHSSEMPGDPEPLARLEENRDHVGLKSNLSAETDSITTTNFSFDSFVTTFSIVRIPTLPHSRFAVFKILLESSPNGLAIAHTACYS